MRKDVQVLRLEDKNAFGAGEKSNGRALGKEVFVGWLPPRYAPEK